MLEVVIMMARWLVVPEAEGHIFAVEQQARQDKVMLEEMARPVRDKVLKLELEVGVPEQ